MDNVNFIKLAAIAAIYSHNNLVGVRLFNRDKLSIVDVSLATICRMINSGAKIQNLGVCNDELVWTSGSIERYPIIRNGMVDESTKNYATVICSYNINGDKKYRIADYTGKNAIMEESKVINLAKLYGLTNCKLVSKENKTEFIQSISGGIPNEELKSFMEVRNKVLFIGLPSKCKSLNIPGVINGKYIPNKIAGIAIVPEYNANSVEELIIPEEIGYIDSNILKLFRNIKKVVINNRNVIIDQDAFVYNTEIEEVYIKGAEIIGVCAFRGCSKLKMVYIEEYCRGIRNKAFSGCTSFDVENFVKQSIRQYDKKVFEGCTASVLNLNIRTNRILVSSFYKIRGLKEIIINADIIDILDNYSKVDYRQFNNLTIVVDEDFKSMKVLRSVMDLDKNTNHNIKIVTKNLKSDKQIVEGIKHKLAGIRSSEKMLKDKDNIAKWIKLTSQPILNNAFLDLINKSVSTVRGNTIVISVGSKEIPFNRFRMSKQRIKNMYSIYNAIIIDLVKSTIIIYTDKNLLSAIVEKARYKYIEWTGLNYPIYKSSEKLKKVVKVEISDSDHRCATAQLEDGKIVELSIKNEIL